MTGNKLSLAFIFWLSITGSPSAQVIWEKRYYDYLSDSPPMYSADTDLKFDSLSSMFVFGGMSHNGLNSVYKLDTLGSFFSRSYYTGIGNSLYNSLFTKDGGAIVSSHESHGYAVQTLFKMDSASTINWKYQYDIPISIPRCGLFETNDYKFLLAVTSNYFPYARPSLIKTDSLGIPVFVKCYKDLFAYSRKIIQTRDGNYLLASNTYMGGGTVLFKTDTSGVVLMAKSYLRPNGFINDVIEKVNGNLILVGNTEVTFQTPIPKMFLMEVDSAGNTLWTKTYGDSINRFIFRPVSFSFFLPIKLKPTTDGGFIIIASIKIGANPYEDLVMLKTDSAGNVQWERRHGIGNQYEVGIQIMQTPDTGYFVAGVFLDDLQMIDVAGYYFLKTDSLGMIGCDEYADVITQTSLLPTDSNIVVTDSTLVINIYPAYVHDTIRQPPDSLPGCVPVGIATNYFEGNELSVYPNPSSGLIHLALNSTVEKDVFVYDLMGREIYARRNASEPVMEINLSQNAKGVYLLTVTSHRVRATAKVVLY